MPHVHVKAHRIAACGPPPRQAYRPCGRRGRVAEGGGLLNRYRVVKPYRGFESLRLRHLRAGALRRTGTLFRARLSRLMPKRPPPFAERPSPSNQVLENAILAFRMQRLEEAERLASEVLKSNRGDT